jgi:glycosyltransferase involved in cell wall biosynthesis
MGEGLSVENIAGSGLIKAIRTFCGSMVDKILSGPLIQLRPKRGKSGVLVVKSSVIAGIVEIAPSHRYDRGAPPLCVHVFPSFGVGGVPLRMARILNDLGGEWRHHVIALDGAVGAAAAIAPSVDCRVVAQPIPKTNLALSLFACCRSLWRQRPDLLLTYNWGAIEWAMANRLVTRFVHIHHEAGFGTEEADRQLPRRVRFRRAALRRARAIIVPSRLLERIAVGEWCLPSAKVLYVPNGIDVGRFATRPVRGIAEGPIVIGTLAPLRPEKNVGRLIRAFAAARARADLRLVIAGDGAERRGLEELARGLGVAADVEFLGQVDHPAEVLARIDIFSLSSDTEQMPNALLEAMAASLPAAAVDVGDIAEMVSEENRRYIVKRDDLHRFADALVELSGHRGLRCEIGAANARRVRDSYSHETMVARWRAILARSKEGAGARRWLR